MISGLPTDDPYKFLALFGIALVLTCLSLAWKTIQNDLDRMERYRTEGIRLITGRKILNEKMEKWVGDARDLMTVPPDAGSLQRVRALVEAGLALTAQHETTLPDYQMFGESLDVWKLRQNLSDRLQRVLYAGVVLGLIITSVGFGGWFVSTHGLWNQISVPHVASGLSVP